MNKIVRYVDTNGPDPEYQRQIADQAVVGAEDGGSERSGELYAAACGEPAQHFAVNPLVSGHPVGGVHIGLIRRAAFCALHQGEHEDATEVRGEEDQQPGAQAAPARRPDVVSE